jgi:hypothetical protein
MLSVNDRDVAGGGMLRFIVILVAFGALLAPRAGLAVEPGSAECKRELQGMHKKMQESLALLDSVKEAPAPAKCRVYSNAGNIADEIRESAARCEAPHARSKAVRDADDVIDAIGKAYEKWCPPRPGMVRVKITMVTRIAPDELSDPLKSLHTCAADAENIFSTNERFDLGRLIVLGCPGTENPTPEQIKTRNVTAQLQRQEQAHIYLARDHDGDDPRRLSFPILTADGAEGATDLLLANRTSIGAKLDLIQSYWEPAKEHVCRVHAVWRVSEAKAKLVLWEEAADCSNGSKTEFKPVLDRR